MTSPPLHRSPRSNGPPARRTERRRIDREQGRQLLFAAAQDIARQQGLLDEGTTASLEQSVLSRTSFALKTEEGTLIARLPLPEVRRMLRFRHRQARLAVSRFDSSANLGLAAPMDPRQRLRLRSDEDRALVWAISQGRRFPCIGPWWRHLLIAAALLLLGVLPGVVYLVWLASRYRKHRQALNELVIRWRSLGKQDPDPSFFRLYSLEG
ncbi:hypothetical protein [Cyanobium sp. NIES-981]|uniref:hypothetical protein n=1 Tax=Cyanobium sp. NIES-981 TaxID=1851505 RepID=UPI0007DD6E49|nr:hypothetical protein [Cyanobium sp. NIES-981]SBO43209.1 conserved protein of unknown function [Cyanobium sp. NIES-981]